MASLLRIRWLRAAHCFLLLFLLLLLLLLLMVLCTVCISSYHSLKVFFLHRLLALGWLSLAGWLVSAWKRRKKEKKVLYGFWMRRAFQFTELRSAQFNSVQLNSVQSSQCGKILGFGQKMSSEELNYCQTTTRNQKPVKVKATATGNLFFCLSLCLCSFYFPRIFYCAFWFWFCVSGHTDYSTEFRIARFLSFFCILYIAQYADERHQTLFYFLFTRHIKFQTSLPLVGQLVLVHLDNLRILCIVWTISKILMKRELQN